MAHLSPASEALLERAIAASRTLGSDPFLVLHGGGNTSVKLPWIDVDGAEVPALLVKGSGCDLADITQEDFTPLRLDLLRRMLPPTALDPGDLANQLACAVLESSAPSASVETLVHAAFPHTCVWHSHSDAILALTNTPRGAQLVADALGERVLIVDYVMPGPLLAVACAQAWEDAQDRHETLEGIVVLQHGLFTFGADPEEALARHLTLVAAADAALPVLHEPDGEPAGLPAPDPIALASLRQEISSLAHGPVMMRRDTADWAARVVKDPRLVEAMQRGPVTPDHSNWIGPEPMVGRDLAAFTDRLSHRQAAALDEEEAGQGDREGWPRVILDKEWGVLSVGRSAAEVSRVSDITRHSVRTVALAEASGGYVPASPDHVDALTRWAPQRAKKSRLGTAQSLQGRVALVTGAASGIGHACATELLNAGAAVVGWDLSPSVVDASDSPAWLGLVVDVTDSDAQRAAIAKAIDAFGGLDIVVVSAGVFPTAQHLGELDDAIWRRTMAVNVDAVAALFREIEPFVALAPGGGDVLVVASKNVSAPGPGAAAYSSSKAALTQLARVAALEWAPKGVRVNMVHPDAVFDTALWTEELLATRAAHYGMSVDEYKRRNLLNIEVTSRHVGRMIRAMADGTFEATTGAQVPIDGGNERVI